MLWFLLGFYMCGVLQAGSLVFVALPQSKPNWGRGQRAAASLALGLFWPVLVPWLLRQTQQRVEAER